MLDQAVHRQHIVTLLLRLYGHTFLGSALALKGGTAAYLFHGLPRFSVDLDFDLLPAFAGRPESWPGVIQVITELIGRDYQIVDRSEKFNTLFWMLSYEKGSPQIKIEVSTRKFASSYEPKVFYGVSMQIMKLADMMAHKLVAIQDRRYPANRDLFDAHYFLSSSHVSQVNYALVKERTGLLPDLFYQSLLLHLEAQKRGQKSRVLDGLGELLTQSQKDWVRASLMDELIELVRLQKDAYRQSKD